MDTTFVKSLQDQVHAIYLAQANIFGYEARKSPKAWVPLCESTVPISILYDSIRQIYRIISVDADIKEVVVNTTIVPELEFVKTTQKFGYWKDTANERAFGIGFASEYEADSFYECLKKVKKSIAETLPSIPSKKSLISVDKEKIEQPLVPLSVAVLDGPPSHTPTPAENNRLNSNYEDIVAPVLSFMKSHRNHFTLQTPNSTTTENSQSHQQPYLRPLTYNINLPSISSKSATNKAQKIQTPVPSSSMPFPSFPCYPGPPSRQQGAASSTHATDTSCYSDANVEKTKSAQLHLQPGDLLEEITRMRAENGRLSQSLIESVCAAKNLEMQLNSLRDDNLHLVRSVAEIQTQLESHSKEIHEKKEETDRWKEQYQRVVTDSKEKTQFLEETEAKLQSISAEKAKIESHMKGLDDELRKLREMNKDHRHNAVTGQFSDKYFKELEEHYRKLLCDSQIKIEEVLRKETDRKNVLRGVDTLFTGAIQGLINIHGQIRQAYNSN